LWIYFRWGWRPAFVVPGLLGLVWLIVWRIVYRSPEDHPRISEAEHAMILGDREEDVAVPNGVRLRWSDLLTCRKPGARSSPEALPIQSGFS